MKSTGSFTSFVGVALLCSGCLHAARTNERLQEQYRNAPTIATTRAAALQSLKDLVVTNGLCLSLGVPCRSESLAAQTPEADVCLVRGRTERECFAFVEADASTIVVKSFTASSEVSPLGLWLIERLDSTFSTRRAAAETQAELDGLAAEKTPVSGPSTFWGHAHILFTVAPDLSAGAQFQAGYRHWLNSSLLLALGGGYQALLTPLSVTQREAVLLTARLEFSSAQKLKSRVLNLPWLAPYIGVTGVFVTAQGGGTGLRGFIGLSSLIPVNIELGVSTLILPNRAPRPAFFVAAGVGL